jgi:hypothetical protein
MIAGQRGCYVTGNQNNHNAEPGLFPSSFSQRKVLPKRILLMKSQGHSTGSLVGKGNFCTKFSNAGTILREIAHTF